MHTPTPQDDLPEGHERLRRALDSSVEGLDAATLSRLNRARQAALEAAAARRRGWRWSLRVGGLALAASAALALVLVPGLLNPPAPPLPAASSDFALLSEDVEPALLEELEFYAWLDSQQDDEAWEG